MLRPRPRRSPGLSQTYRHLLEFVSESSCRGLEDAQGIERPGAMSFGQGLYGVEIKFLEAVAQARHGPGGLQPELRHRIPVHPLRPSETRDQRTDGAAVERPEHTIPRQRHTTMATPCGAMGLNTTPSAAHGHKRSEHLLGSDPGHT